MMTLRQLRDRNAKCTLVLEGSYASTEGEVSKFSYEKGLGHGCIILTVSPVITNGQRYQPFLERGYGLTAMANYTFDKLQAMGVNCVMSGAKEVGG